MTSVLNAHLSFSMADLKNKADQTESTHTKLKEYWENMWKIKNTHFHQVNTHPDLVKYETLLLNPSSRVYIPLCGKSVDLIHLADKGHDVCGCEWVEMAITSFFEEQNLKYIVSTIPSGVGNIYKAISKKITIYQGDFFAFNANVIGKFDAIWDRASIVAINPSQRAEYVKVLLDILAPHGKCLLNLLVITGKEYCGPPHSFADEDVHNFFGSFCDIESLDGTYFSIKNPKIEKLQFNNKLLCLK